MKVGFKDLSLPLKIAIVTAYVLGVLYVLSFLIGFILGVIESLS